MCQQREGERERNRGQKYPIMLILGLGNILGNGYSVVGPDPLYM